MDDALFNVDSAFSIEGRGVCLTTGIPVDRPCPVQVEQYLHLKAPCGYRSTVRIRAVEFLLLSASPPKEEFAILLHNDKIDPDSIPPETRAFAVDDSWRQGVIGAPIVWEGDLDDDCTARWAGLTLRAEEMDRGFWWWCAYDDDRDSLQIASSNEVEVICKSGDEARKLAEKAGRAYVSPM